MMKKFGWPGFITLLLAFVLWQQGCEIPGLGRNVKLAVVVVVDQMRADHLTRFAGLYQGGLARLLQEGRVYTNAHHDHAITVTAAGHATIATGSFPSHHGVISNSWFDREEQREVYCSEDTSSRVLGYPDQEGRSSRRLLVEALGDWMKKKWPQSKVYAVSRKDRPAIMMAGKRPDGVFWYNSRDGRFVTSEFYAQTYPAWVDSFNNSSPADRYFETGWTKSRPEEAYFVSREDKFAHEFDGIHTTFPHQFPGVAGRPNAAYYRALSTSPFSDELVLEFAKTLIAHEGLGKDGIPDVLFIGCSAADAIGHAFGPLSQESEDHFLRLDDYLGRFMNFLDETVGKDRYVLVLSSDHGVLPLPEELARRGFESRRLPFSDMMAQVNQAVGKVIRTYNLKGNPIKGFSNGFLLDDDVIAASGVGRKDIEDAIAAALKELPFIEDVYTYSEMLQTNGQDERPFLEQYRRSFHPQRSADLVPRLKPYYLLTSRAQGTSHGSPYEYDTHVPIIFIGSGVPPGRIHERVRTVDIAPTLAALLGVDIPAEVDGKALF